MTQPPASSTDSVPSPPGWDALRVRPRAACPTTTPWRALIHRRARWPAGGAQSRFLTADDGVRLHYLRWSSGPSPPRAVVIFLHGIASHAGWFGETAADLNHQGIAVYGPDRRGCGRSGGPRGHITRYQRALDDIEQVVRLVASEHKGTPVFLAASSWAAKLAVLYAGQRPAPLSGCCCLAPA